MYKQHTMRNHRYYSKLKKSVIQKKKRKKEISDSVWSKSDSAEGVHKCCHKLHKSLQCLVHLKLNALEIVFNVNCFSCKMKYFTSFGWYKKDKSQPHPITVIFSRQSSTLSYIFSINQKPFQPQHLQVMKHGQHFL